MPFQARIQPVSSYAEPAAGGEIGKQVPKSRLKRLLDLQFLKISSAEKAPVNESRTNGRDSGSVFEPNTIGLDKLVRNYIEDSQEKLSVSRCPRSRCNCFNGSSYGSDDEFYEFSTFNDHLSSADACEILQRLSPCGTVAERNLLADVAKIIDGIKNCERKNEITNAVVGGLSNLRYDASICKSRWERSPFYLAGEYEFIDVVVEEQRLLIDVDFRSEFEIARPTSNYKWILQSLPSIFVGKHDRLEQILPIVSDAAKQSLKKRGMPVPPWRKLGYLRAKWLSPYTRSASSPVEAPPVDSHAGEAPPVDGHSGEVPPMENGSGEAPPVENNSGDAQPCDSHSGKTL